MSDRIVCQTIEESLAQVLDGTAPASAYEHIAECATCRDARHEAARAAELVAQAGADFAAPVGFEAKILAGLDAPSADTQATRDSGERATAGGVPPTRSDAEVSRDLATAPTALAPTDAPHGARSDAAHADTGRSAPSGAAEARPAHVTLRERARAGVSIGAVAELFRKRSFLLALAATMSAAAIGGFALRGYVMHRATHSTDPWSARVVEIARAGGGDGGGLEACDAKGSCKAVAANADIAAGWTLRTDPRTRARLALSDGSELALDRGSTIELVKGLPRTATLASGTVVLDVAHHEGAPSAHVSFADGDAEIVGTKLAITATEGRASVEVARGIVRVHDRAGHAVDVRAGEEATMMRGSEPVVASATTLADSLEWSDKSPEEVDAPALRGIGELRARKPGSTKDKEHAVRLAKHAVKVRIVDVVARTEIDETFANDTDEELEGTFRFPIPPGAQIEKLALEVDGKLVEGAFVDRDKGAAIWRGVIQNAAPKTPKPREEIIWVPGPWRDPALLEWQRGGRFELRIFPIPKRGSRRVVLSYTQLVDQAAGVRRFTYALPHDPSGTTRIDSFDLDVQVLGHDPKVGVQTRGYTLTRSAAEGAAERQTMHADGFVPSGDLTVEYALPDRDRELTAWAYAMDPPAPAEPAPVRKAAAQGKASATPTAEQTAAVEAANAILTDRSPYVAIALRPKLPRWEKAVERVHAIVVDASRSMFGERFARASHLAAAVVREMDRRDTFVLLACDTQCRPMTNPDGSTQPMAPGAAASTEVERFLSTVEPDGGSDLAAAMSAAAAAANGGKELRIEYLGDGTPTVGPLRASHLETAVRRALPANAAVVAVALGTDADTSSLASLARGGGGVVLPYVPGQRVTSAALDVLAAAYGRVLRDPQVELPQGLVQVTPAQLDPIRAGGEAFVFARMTGEDITGTLTVKGRIDGEPFEQRYPMHVVSSRAAGNAFVPRLFAAAKIAELDRVGGDANKTTIVELSRRFAVASRFTSLLVLESEAMFDAFGLARKSAAPTFTGEDAAESASADAESPVDDAAEAPAGFAGSGFGRGGGGSPARAVTSRSAPRPAMHGPQHVDASDPWTGGDDIAKKDKSGERTETKAGAANAAPTPAPESQPAASATMAPPPPPAAKPRATADAKEIASPFDPLVSSEQRARRMIPMKRIFERKAAFEATNTLARDNATKLISAEAALQSAPDSRDKTLDLFALYATSGRVGEAEELTARWSGRDALDPDALLARADLAARRGDRARAIRVLSGLVDVRPGDRAAQLRLADLHDTAAEPALACEHRIAAAETGAPDASALAGAIRCTREQAMPDLAAQLQADAPPAIRDAIEKLLAGPARPKDAVRGDVQLKADWSSPVDLDVALIDSRGRRISWMGGTAKLGVTARDVTSPRGEELGLANLPAGNYVIEIARAAGGDAAAEPVRGQIALRLPGETRTVPFVLTGARAEVGTLRVFFTSRLVPVAPRAR